MRSEKKGFGGELDQNIGTNKLTVNCRSPCELAVLNLVTT